MNALYNKPKKTARRASKPASGKLNLTACSIC